MGIAKFVDKYLPGKQLGIYRYLPLYFAAGALLEFTMIKWKPGNVNFYSTFKKRQAERIVDYEIAIEQRKQSDKLFQELLEQNKALLDHLETSENASKISTTTEG